MDDIFETDNVYGERFEISAEGGWVRLVIDSHERASTVIHKHQALAAARAILTHFNQDQPK